MTEFVKYPHLERFGTDEVDGINLGTCYIFPKIDGTNGQVWLDQGDVVAGSRNRTLTLDNDNQGFYAWVLEQDNIKAFLYDNPCLRLYGEWLVPHSLKTYREDAWRKFYIFDVFDDSIGEFLSYEEYKRLLDDYKLEYIPCTLKATNPDYELLSKACEHNKYLIQENQGAGEGIVVKQYGWKNRFGRTTWAKLITNTFKDKHIKEMGGAVVDLKMVEEEIANEFITQHTVDKVVEKIRNDQGSFGAKDIPRLLHTVYHELVVEELWEAIKKHKNPKIDFKVLNQFSIKRTKELKKELFGL